MSDNALHSDQTIADGVHIAHAFEYVDAVARNGASVIAADIGKIARQLDNGTFYILQDIVPTWAQIDGGTSSGWQDDGVVTRLVTPTDNVSIGDTTMAGAEKLRVVGDSRLEGDSLHKTHATHPGSEGIGRTVGISHPSTSAPTDVVVVTLDDDSVYSFVVRVQARDTTASAQLVHHIRFMVYREAAGGATVGSAGMQTDFIDKTNAATTWTGLSLNPTGNDIEVEFQTDASDPAEVTGTVEYQKVGGP